jgi:hypothetical protein
MGDLVNLNRYRKSKQRKADERHAAMNREKFGQSKAETERSDKLRRRIEKTLAGKKIESPEDPG